LRWGTAGEPARLHEEGAEIVIVGTGSDDVLGVDVLAPPALPACSDPAADRIARECAPQRPRRTRSARGRIARCVDSRHPDPEPCGRPDP